MKKMFLFLVLSSFSLSVFAAPPWFVSKVVEVSTDSSGHFFIRTVLNPNPANCPGTWAGAQYGSINEISINLAASLSLSAKVTNNNIRFQIDDENCGVGGLPIMRWIQQR